MHMLAKIPHFLILVLISALLCGCPREPATKVSTADHLVIEMSDVGQGEVTLLLVHGWANDRSIWMEQIPVLAQDYRVIAPDLPGFGQSGFKRRDWTIEAFSKDVLAIIEQLGLKNVVLVGFSMGAPICVEAASTGNQSVIGVVIVDTMQDSEEIIPDEVKPVIVDQMIRMVSDDPATQPIENPAFYKRNPEIAFQRILQMRKAHRNTEMAGWRESLENTISWFNTRKLVSLSRVDVPVHGIFSDSKPVNVSAYASLVPAFTYVVLENTGHVVMWDDPVGFNQSLAETIAVFTSK